MKREYQILCISSDERKEGKIGDIAYQLLLESAMRVVQKIIFKERKVKSGMIVVSCESYKEACKAYRVFVDILESNEPWSIKEKNDLLNSIETDDDLHYIFVDYRVANVFDALKPDIVDLSEFFEIEGLTSCEEVMEYYYYI